MSLPSSKDSNSSWGPIGWKPSALTCHGYCYPVLNVQAFQIKFNTFKFCSESGFLAASPMRCVTMRRFLKFSELFPFHFEQHLPLIDVRSCVVLVVVLFFFRRVWHMSLNASLFPSIMLLICACLLMSLGLSPIIMLHAPRPGKISCLPWRRLWVCRGGPSPRQAQLRQSCSHTRHFLHPQRNDRSGKPMLIKAGSLVSLILICVPTCRYVMPSISWLWLNFLASLFLLLSGFSWEGCWLAHFHSQPVRVC